MRLAAIDIGSNSVKLLICEFKNNASKTILFEARVTGLSKTMSAARLLTQSSIDNTTAVIEDYLAIARKQSVAALRITATAWARKSTNANDLLTRIHIATGCAVDVISGDEEASLTYAAVMNDFGSTRTLIFNIGGGSTEFIIGKPEAIELQISIPIGVGQLSHDFLTSTNTISAEEYARMKLHISNILHERIVPTYLAIANEPGKIVLSGGTGVNLAQIAARSSIDWNNVNVPSLSADKVLTIEQHLLSLNLQQRQSLPGIQPDRADVLPAGIAITSCVLSLCRARKLFITHKSLAYGIIIALRNNIQETIHSGRSF